MVLIRGDECRNRTPSRTVPGSGAFQKVIAMQTFAVVPIAVNAGAAALPAIIAAAASLTAVLFKPRALMQLIQRRKVASAVAMTAVVLLAVAGYRWHVHSSSLRAARNGLAQHSHIDWAKVAEDIIAQEKLRQVSGLQIPSTPAEPPSVAAIASKGTATPLLDTLPAVVPDFSRAQFKGGRSPAGLTPVWSYKPEGTLFLGAPAIVGKRLYVAGCQSDLGGYTGLFACLDLETGKPLWETTQIGSDPLRPFFSSPAVTADGKFVVIGQGLHQDRDCSLLCFNAATGRQVWAVKTPLHLESSPAIRGDIAVIGAGAIEGADGKASGDPGFVLGVRISDGKLLWKQAVNDPESSPAIDEHGMVYIGSGCNGQAVVAIRSGSDEELQQQKLERVAWRTPVAYPMLAPITLVSNAVIASGGNGDMVHSGQNPQGLVVALSRADGSILWQTKLEDAVLGAVAFQDQRLVCPVRNGEVVALAIGDGHILWRARVSGNAPVLCGCAVTHERACAVSNDGYLAALATTDGKILEKLYLNDQGQPGTGLSITSPQVVDNRIIVGSETGGLRCLQGSGTAQ
jgi:outer membrane protein assembly factor BamB